MFNITKSAVLFVVAFAFLLLSVQNVSADVYSPNVAVPKVVYGPGERIEIYGNLTNLTANSTPVVNGSVTIRIVNSTRDVVYNYTLNSTSDGTFYSRNDYSQNATLISTPNLTGNYTVNMTYTAPDGVVYVSSNIINVVSRRVDDIRITMSDPVYYPSTSMGITAETVTVSGNYRLPVANMSINGTIRDSTESVVSSFNCTTDANGKCNVTKTSPSTAGNYIIEANNFIGYTTFRVVPFEVDVYIMDDTGKTLKYTFQRGQTGYVEVRASYNKTNPTGTFTVTGGIYDSSGTIISNLTSFELNSNNSYISKGSFSIGSSAAMGTYIARVNVTKTGDGTVSGTASFQVKGWELSFSKTSANNGFDSGYAAFGNTTVYFKADATDLANGTTITGLDSNFTIKLKNYLGIEVANATASYNSTLDDYLFNITTPNAVGTYTVYVSALYSGETQAAERIIIVTNTSATVTSADVIGTKKDVFTLSEFVFLKITGKNSTSDTNVTDAEVVSVRYEDGTAMNYTTTTNCTNMNLSDTNLQWCWQSNGTMVKIDPPKTGGLFTVELYVNNRSSSTTGRFFMKPYNICTSAKASESTNVNTDYYWQFKTTDTIYMLLTIVQTQDTSSLTSNISSTMGDASGMYYGRGSACSVGSTDSAVENATISILKVVNIQSGKTETLNATSSVCKSITLSSKAAYMCTLQPDDGRWDGGRYYAVFDVTGPDETTKDKGYGAFEARSFYLYGWSNTWQNKPTANITFHIYMYSGGSGWWAGTGGGLSGTVSLEKIVYLGSSWLEWITPTTYDYNTQGMSSVTITNGAGNITLNASRAPNGRWRSGMYRAVIKGTDTTSGESDYGEMWFEVRNWYAWAQPVEVVSGNYQYKYQVNTRENVSLYVKISNAGADYWGYGQDLGNNASGNGSGNVTIRVKKLEYYTTWPPKELPASNYTSTNISPGKSNCDLWSANSCSGIDSSKYIINISPTSGRWPSGYYSVLLDLNGTETGWGWFSALAFYVQTQAVNVNGSYTYASRGRGPTYINVTTTKNQRYYSYWYSATDYINTTFSDMVLHRWDSTTYRQIDLNYPQDINVTVVNRSAMNITGSGMLNITYLSSGTWPSGYYYGEVTMMDNESDTATGWIWFSIEPFRVDAQSRSWTIASEDNVTADLHIYEPGWTWPYTVLPGNYTITQILERKWTYSGEQITNITNYTPSRTATFNGSNTTLRIQPPSGGWTAGWKYLTVYVKNTDTNETKEGWLYFRVMPFNINVQRNSAYTIGMSNNLSIRVSLTHPTTGANATGNLSSVYKWTWPSRTTYTFVVGNCSSAVFSSCTINGTQDVTIVPPAGGWEEGYNYVYFTFTQTADATPIEDWSSVWFEARPTIQGYMYGVDSNGNYMWAATDTSNVTMYIYSVSDSNWNRISVNVTNVQYYYTSMYSWTPENQRTYTNATWSVINITTGQPMGHNEIINGAGYVKLVPPSGTWTKGDYYVKITVSTPTDTGTIKNGYFKIKDMTPPVVTINRPTYGELINTSTAPFNITTSKRATCSMNILNYGNYRSWYCGSNTTGLCNSSAYSGSTYYYAYISQWYFSEYTGSINQWAYSSSMTTGDTSHQYSHPTTNMPNQDYVVQFWCNDYDWNYASNVTWFRLNVTASNATNATAALNITSVLIRPASPTTSDTLRCNATARSVGGENMTVYTRWYRNGTMLSDVIYQNATNVTNGTNTEVSTVNSGNLTAGHIWSCSVRAGNGTAYSNWTNSSNVSISSAGGSNISWSNSAVNSTLAGNHTKFSVFWNSSAGLSGYVFSTNNTGSWVNDSWVAMAGTGNWSNVTKTLNSTVGIRIGWRVYANNSNNAWNETGIISLTTTIS